MRLHRLGRGGGGSVVRGGLRGGRGKSGGVLGGGGVEKRVGSGITIVFPGFPLLGLRCLRFGILKLRSSFLGR